MSYYHGLISSRKASSVLDAKGDGSFLIRDSQSQPGSFVLSARSGSRVYHVLIFHRGGQYYLDSAVGGGDGEENPAFESLDDLVEFLMGHDLRVEGTEVHFAEAVACADDHKQPHTSSPSRKAKSKDDHDELTDLFATLFGRHVSVLSTAHSRLSVDGQELEGKEHLGVVVRDSKQKGFFIRIVDPEGKKVLGEKRITRNFQYDTPEDLVMTYLSEHGITCIGFRDVWERERFLHQVDRVVRLQQGQGIRLRARGDSDARHIEGPTEMTHRVKAEDFNIPMLTPEWQYLFDLAGVTHPMLEDTATLQFILDTVYQLGGAPINLEHVRQEAVSTEWGRGKSPKKDDHRPERKEERAQALAIDYALRRESLRASKLSDELKKRSMKRDFPIARASGCAYKAACERYKDHLMLKHSMYALGPELSTCYCEVCMAGQPLVQVSGSPPQQYSLPVRWCQFVHRSQKHELSQHFRSRWHAAYCCVPCSRVAGVLRTGQLPQSYSTGEIRLSPDLHQATHMASITPERYYDDVTDRHYRVSAAFQLYIQPETYTVCVPESEDGPSLSPLLHSQLEWHAREQTYTIHAFLIQMVPAD